MNRPYARSWNGLIYAPHPFGCWSPENCCNDCYTKFCSISEDNFRSPEWTEQDKHDWFYWQKRHTWDDYKQAIWDAEFREANIAAGRDPDYIDLSWVHGGVK